MENQLHAGGEPVTPFRNTLVVALLRKHSSLAESSFQRH